MRGPQGEIFYFTVDPPTPWDKRHIEDQFDVAIPADLETLWRYASRIRLFMLEP
jgi:hypothetical protein